MSSLDDSLLDATLYALALGCPRCTGQPDCVLHSIHRMPVSMRFSAIRRLTPQQRAEALRGHETCVGQALRHGPLVEACLRLLQIERRIGTEEEKAGDMDCAVFTAHELRNMMIHIMAEDRDLLLE